MDKKDMEEAFKERGYYIEDCTCETCPDKESCRYAYDLYNTQGDCLAMK